ncbi:MAG: homocysteine S-methyltransferase [Myxococcota bacterium]
MAEPPWASILARRGALIVDGGLATELEADGYDLDHPLWSARLLLEAPAAIRAVHRRYLEAGADVIIAATYQATVQGLQALGHDGPAAAQILAGAVALAVEERDARAPAALVAASVGPYGAFLADGSEYRGRYGLSDDALRAFHAPRWAILQATDADLVVAETVPELAEVAVLAEQFAEPSSKPGWISVSCRDGAHLNDGSPIGEVVPLVTSSPGVHALGINCTAPEHVTPLLEALRDAGLGKPVVVYPNSGETYDPIARRWTGHASVPDYVALARQWRALGAVGIGGCCRTTPAHVRSLRVAL